MISADIVMYGLGIFFILSAVYLVAVLILRKSIWNYPPITAVYIALAILFLFFGIIIIEQIEITSTMITLEFAAIIIWGIITSCLPARKNDLDEQKSR